MTAGPSGTTIRRIELCVHPASARSTWTVVRVTADSGEVGLGECSDAGDAAILGRSLDAARSALVGADIDEGRDALRAWLGGQRDRAEPASALAWSTALGGIESALEDLRARRRGVPLAEHLGTATPGRVRLYANLNRAWGDRGVGDLVGAARTAAAEGFCAVKIAPFDTASGTAGASRRDVLSAGLAAIDAVRDALPERTGLMIDCHFRLDDRTLQRALPELAARKIFWLEDAVHPGRVDRLRWLRDRTELPLAAGEHEWDPTIVEAACRSGTVDFWLIDPKHAGGPGATARLVELAGEVTVSYHNPSGPVGTVHAAQLCALSRRVTWLEYAWGEPERAGYLRPSENLESGELVVPAGPGIAVDLATAHRPMEVRP